jgi:hypothetical protein
LKTRVVRHWHSTDWVYSVEIWEQVKPDDQFVDVGGDRYQLMPTPKVGSWRWRRYIAAIGGTSGIAVFSQDRALSIASRLAQNLPQEDADVIAEFGDA